MNLNLQSSKATIRISDLIGSHRGCPIEVDTHLHGSEGMDAADVAMKVRAACCSLWDSELTAQRQRNIVISEFGATSYNVNYIRVTARDSEPLAVVSRPFCMTSITSLFSTMIADAVIGEHPN